MSMNLPLNPALFRRLHHLFGDVGISNAGREYTFYPTMVDGKRRQRVQTYGENYLIACPYCHHHVRGDVDGGRHLSIGYLWGVPGPDGDQRWWMANCYRHQCLSEQRFRKDLQDRVWDGYDRGRRASVEILPGETMRSLPEVVDWPGECLELKWLPPSHPAISYLRSRNMDPCLLGELYGVRFCICPHADYPTCNNRLIIPIIQNGKMVTWQARYVGNIDWKGTGIPKYYNQPGGRKSHCLYGLDLAKASPIVTVVESAPSVWWRDLGMGTSTVAILGKSVSDAQLRLLKTNWQAAVIALDDNAYLQSEDAFVRLKDFMPVVRLTLQKGQDAGEMPHDMFWDLVAQAAREQGVNLLV